MRRSYLIIAFVFFFVLVVSGYSSAQRPETATGPIVVCILHLDYADAEYLATVLKPFLSPEGSLSPYKPTNSLIIKDRESVVNMLAETIKGEPCIPASQTSKRNHAGVRVDSSTPQILGICR